MTKGRDRFLSALDMLGRTAARLEFHRRILAPVMPVDAQRLASLKEPALTHVEAMLRKLDQFVDGLQCPVAHGVLTLAAEPVERMSQRQVFNHMETLGCIESAEAVLRVLGLTSLAHEQPDRLDVQAAVVTRAWQAIPELLAMLAGIRGYIVRAGLVAREDLPPYPPMA